MKEDRVALRIDAKLRKNLEKFGPNISGTIRTILNMFFSNLEPEEQPTKKEKAGKK